MPTATTLSCVLLILCHASDGVPLNNQDEQIPHDGNNGRSWESHKQIQMTEEYERNSPGGGPQAVSVDLKDSANDHLKLPSEHHAREADTTPSCYNETTSENNGDAVITHDCRNVTSSSPSSPTVAYQVVPTNANRTAQTLPADYYTDRASGVHLAFPDNSDQAELTSIYQTIHDKSQSSQSNAHLQLSFNGTAPVDDYEVVRPVEGGVANHEPAPTNDYLAIESSDNQTTPTSSYYAKLLSQTRGVSAKNYPHGTRSDNKTIQTNEHQDVLKADEESPSTNGYTGDLGMVEEAKTNGNHNAAFKVHEVDATGNHTLSSSDYLVQLGSDNKTEPADTQQTTVASDSQVAAKDYQDEDVIPDHERNPEVRPGLFEGDMVLDTEENSLWRVGLRRDVHKKRLWSNNTVPYVISPLYEPEDYVTIYKAITAFNFMTCIRFVPWDGKAKDYVLIWPVKYPKGCWSHVGRRGGPQLVSLQPPDGRSRNCLGGEGRAIHELMHTLGIFHEQARADRDTYVHVHEDNICKGYKKNFKKQSLENTTYAFEYDYNSIMHYGKYFFSKKRGKPTITAKLGKKVRLGQRRAMSKTDCLKVNHLYNCLKSRRYYTLCNVLGI